MNSLWKAAQRQMGFNNSPKKTKRGKKDGRAATALGKNKIGRGSEKKQTISSQTYRSTTLKNYAVIFEYKRLRHCAPNGVYVLPSATDIRRWFGVLFVHDGPYRGAIFKFLLSLPPSYPGDGQAPSVAFITDVYHPLVNPRVSAKTRRSNEFTVEAYANPWRVDRHSIAGLLAFIMRALHSADNSLLGEDMAPANQQAFKLFAKPEFRAEKRLKINLCVQRSIDREYKCDPDSSLQFAPPIDKDFKFMSRYILSHKLTEKQENLQSFRDDASE